jgi:hypothetical protein
MLTVMPELDEAKPTIEDRTPGYATFIDCGRPENYLFSRISSLSDIARQAVAAGKPIGYC